MRRTHDKPKQGSERVSYVHVNYTVSPPQKKERHQTHGDKSVNPQPIFRFISLEYGYTYCHTYYWYSITHSLFHSMLKSFLFCKSSLPSLSFFSFRIHYMDFPYCLLLLLSTSVYLLFSFFCFYTFLVVGSVPTIKLTYVGFRAHVKIASRIVSYRIGNKPFLI